MTRISGIAAQPGGRVAISFWQDGLVVAPEHRPPAIVRYAARLVSGWAALLALLVFLSASYLQPLLAQHDAPAVLTRAMEPVGFVALGYVLVWLLVRAVPGIIDEAGGHLLLGLLVISLPLLLVPAYRAWFRQTFSSGPGTARPADRDHPGWVASADMSEALVSRDGNTTTVTVRYTGGTRAEYHARGSDGRHLAREFQRLSRGFEPRL